MMSLKETILALTLMSLTIAFLYLGSYRRTQAQNGYVCAKTRTCSTVSLKTAFPMGVPFQRSTFMWREIGIRTS
jgi:hypothetical protein